MFVTPSFVVKQHFMTPKLSPGPLGHPSLWAYYVVGTVPGAGAVEMRMALFQP